MLHSEMLVRLPDFGFQGQWHAGENQPATIPYTSDEDRSHVDQGSGEHGTARPGAHPKEPPPDQRRPFRTVQFPLLHCLSIARPVPALMASTRGFPR